MDWNYIESTLKVSPESKAERAGEIFTSLAHLESEFGTKWIEEIWPFPPGNQFVEYLVNFAKCLKITDVIENGQVLRQKLTKAAKTPIGFDKYIVVPDTFAKGRVTSGQMVSGYHAREARDAMAEAHVAIRLVAGRGHVTYEPKLPSKFKRPDFVTRWDSKLVGFEVTKLELSAQDTEQWRRRQPNIGKMCGEILPGGSLDIYITEPEITKKTLGLILESIQNLLKECSKGGYCEYRVSDAVYFAYDSTGSVRADRTNPPILTKKKNSDKTQIGACICDVKGDRSDGIKKKLNVSDPMPVVAYLGKRTLSDGSEVLAIVRVYRVAVDNRVMTKIIDKSNQLPSHIPGIVVVDMSSTTACQRDWAVEIHKSFGSKLYSEISAVWLRSATMGDNGLDWSETLIRNTYSTHFLPDETVRLLLPSGKEIDTDSLNQ